MRCTRKNGDADEHAEQRARAGAGRSQAAEHERNRQQRGEQDGRGARDARPEREFLFSRVEIVLLQMMDQVPQHAGLELARRGHGQRQEIAADRRVRTRGCPGAGTRCARHRTSCWRNARVSSCRRPARWPWSRCPRISARDPAVSSKMRMPPNSPPPGLLRNIDQQVAVAHPGTGAAREGDGGKLGEQLLLLGHGLQRRREEFAADHRERTPAEGRPWPRRRRCATPRYPPRASR